MSVCHIYINEEKHTCAAGTRVQELCASLMPRANVFVANGAPVTSSYIISDGDIIEVFVKGEVPPQDVFARMYAARHGAHLVTQLHNARVGIAGLGGIGAYTTRALARAGCGTLVLADRDIVTPSNLHRQAYDTQHIGMPKAHALTEAITAINPYVTAIPHVVTLTPDTIPEIFSDVDICIEALDVAETKTMLIETVLCALPHVTVIGVSGVAGIAPTDILRVRRINARFYLIGDETHDARHEESLVATRVGCAANMIAHCALRLIAEKD